MKNIIARIILFGFIMTSGTGKLHADEGMWLLMYLQNNYDEMSNMGLELQPEDIYSVNRSSLKDAIVSLKFCTAELVSEEGLMFTNHHCAYSSIQAHSSVEDDYLTDGFWAGDKSEELPAKGITASILVRMEDVSTQILDQVKEGMSTAARSEAIQKEIKKIAAEAENGNDYRTEVKSMFKGNQYILFVYETYEDVRLVGAPPSSIGKFGGDEDNWEWPRHTGDFALLRVYTAPDGSPAKYSEDNIPYKPRHHLPISLKGASAGDFSMVMGFPGGTQRYLSSYGIEMAQKSSNPARIKARTKVLDVLKQSMNASDSIRIKYASRYSSISNYWKYYIGQNEGLKRLNTIGKKKTGEAAFHQWANATAERKDQYGNVIPALDSLYDQLEKYDKYVQYINEAAFASRPMLLASRTGRLEQVLTNKDATSEELGEVIQKYKSMASGIFENYHQPTEQRLFAEGLELFHQGVPEEQMPAGIDKLNDKYRGNWDKYATRAFRKSVFDTREELMDFLEDPSAKKLRKDPVFETYKLIMDPYNSDIRAQRSSLQSKLDSMQRIYLRGMMEMDPEKNFYPDANSTLRLTYGTVKGYHPKDAVYFDYYTTMDGIMAKEDADDDEFTVPARLKELYEKKDYGSYGVDGEMRVNFITNNDITGGNSGSPIINGRGELTGIAFDGNWEAMTGDLVYDEEFKRCINVDIRYVLFIIDKYANAGHLIEEMDIVP